MKKLLLTTAFVIGFVSHAEAKGHHHYHHQHHHRYVHVASHHSHHVHRVHNMVEGLGVGLAHMLHSIQTVQSDAGPITVATAYANNFRGLIHDFVEAGYKPKDIGCYARGGHVAHSRHYLGEACDFDQTGWGKTAHFMYSHQAAEIIHKWGFTNGCSFRDCGHVGTDGQRRHYANR